MAATQFKTGFAALTIAGAATILVIQHISQTEVREENQSLRRQIGQLEADYARSSNRVAWTRASRAPRLPAPPMQSVAAPDPVPAEGFQTTELNAQLMAKNPPKLTAEQVAPYLDANRRNAASLLAAYRTTEDPALLQEAMQRFPSDPRVGFEAALRKGATAAERRPWLDAFKQSAPENALANYLSAADYFKAGQPDQAVQELIAATGKRQFQDYTLGRTLDDDEAFRAAGYPVAQAKLAATMQLVMPQLVHVRDLNQEMINLASSYRQAGDEASGQAVLQMAVNLGQRYSAPSAGESLVSQLVGVSVERIALSAMDPNSLYSGGGQTVQDRINQLVQQREAIRELTGQAAPLFQSMSEQHWISYHNWSAAFGEEAAMRWLVGKYGQK